MRAIEIEAEPYNFEVILCCGRWLLSTFVQGFCEQYALEAAEKYFLAHAAQHGVYPSELQAEFAYVIAGGGSCFFKKRGDGSWWLAQHPAQEARRPVSRGNSLVDRQAAA